MHSMRLMCDGVVIIYRTHHGYYIIKQQINVNVTISQSNNMRESERVLVHARWPRAAAAAHHHPTTHLPCVWVPPRAHVHQHTH